MTRCKTAKARRVAARTTTTRVTTCKTGIVTSATVRKERVAKNETTKTATRITRSKTDKVPNATVRKYRVKKNDTTKTSTRMTRSKTHKVTRLVVRKTRLAKGKKAKTATRINRSRTDSATRMSSGLHAADSTRALQRDSSERLLRLDRANRSTNPESVVDPSRVTAIDVAHVNMYYYDDDEHMCIKVTGSTPVSADRILLTDQFNSKVKLIDTCTQELIGELHLESAPWDIALINTNQAVVTLPRDQEIILFEVAETLMSQRKIPVGGECRGVAYNQDRLIVTFVDSPRVEIIDLYGNVLGRIENARDGSKLFHRPKYVCVSNDGEAIYVSDYSRDTVTRLTYHGEVKSVYKDEQLIRPRKVCTDRNGNVYVCGYDSHNVHLITADCRKITLTLTQADSRNIYAMSHCQHTNRLFISNKHTQILKIFQLDGVPSGTLY